jgi:XTP/dITP diphosphohydrolase
MEKELINIRFVSRNEFKLKEAREILAPTGINVVPLNIQIEELQTIDTERLVKDKALKAFAQIGRPLFVEHTGLYLDYINNLPGGLTQIFWDALEADRFTMLFGSGSETRVVAKTLVCFTDTKRFFLFEGEVKGRIAPIPRGPRGFQWDCVFIPDGYSQTFAEMGPEKNKISMRRHALDRFGKFLSEREDL